MLPNQKILEQISHKISKIPNHKGEYKRNIHKGCYLLCYQSGLRISEAIKFNPQQKTQQGLYRIEKPKGKQERFVYISPKVIKELRKNN
jgi:site-specific recombinase XerD